MTEVSRVLTELLAVPRALERSLADPGREPDLDLLRARASLVDRLRGVLKPVITATPRPTSPSTWAG